MTKSYKDGKYCVAGIDYFTSKWVRLVSNDENYCGAIDNNDLIYEEGSIAEPLDLIKVNVNDSPINYRFQKENVLLNQKYAISKIKKLSLNEFINFYSPENHEVIFGNRYGIIDKDSDILNEVNSSLVFIKVNNLQIFKDNKAIFDHNGSKYYYYSVTDPDYRHNDLKIPSAYIVVSFPEHYYSQTKKYYKFIAKIFTL
ncbi:hypothetical protein SDC9_37506 [bioreactor metagenome]|uniref:Dual OB-containing domain-containing protein n=1 Tax=bioreactor metagenome TaxID=1076179 RepID=A0A644VJB8_9ZZZZ|nr:hypothetical protein [Methanobrevibacter sp.]MEA4958021.1 hypothetical protein [Methanobrevibacter sp.]